MERVSTLKGRKAEITEQYMGYIAMLDDTQFELAAEYLVMAAILIVQCLIFQDGGLLALGTNIFNLGIVPCYLGGGLFALQPEGCRNRWAARTPRVPRERPGVLPRGSEGEPVPPRLRAKKAPGPNPSRTAPVAATLPRVFRAPSSQNGTPQALPPRRGVAAGGRNLTAISKRWACRVHTLGGRQSFPHLHYTRKPARVKRRRFPGRRFF